MPMKSPPTGWRLELQGTLSLTEAARRLRVSVDAVRGLLGRQAMAFVEIRGRIRIPESEIQHYQIAHPNVFPPEASRSHRSHPRRPPA